MKFITKLILSISYFWYINDVWDWSEEMDYTRKPRQFIKNRILKDYMITSVFIEKPYSITESVIFFIKDFEKKTI